MIKKLLLSVTLFSSVFIINAQTLLNLVFETEIQPSAATAELTFDYSGVSAGDVFEWQLISANPDGSANFATGTTIAYLPNIVPNTTGSGTQTVTLNVFGGPMDGEIYTWAGKITLASDGSDTGFNNFGNLVTISSTASTEGFAKNNTISVYPNPVGNELNIKTQGSEIDSIAIIDLAGRIVKEVNNVEIVNVSNLKQGFYFIRTNDRKTVKFFKK